MVSYFRTNTLVSLHLTSKTRPTPIEWVIEVLVNTFKHSQSSAEALTLQIHSEGSAVVGVYSYEIAEQKSVETTVASRDKGFPLQIRLEKE